MTAWLVARIRLRSERGAAIISAIYVMIILTIMGFGILALKSNDGRMVAQERKTNQALNIAESGADQMAHRYTLPSTADGVATDYTNADADLSIDQAIAQGQYAAYNVLDSQNSVIGKAKIIVQAANPAEPNERRITSYGQYCLDPQCTKLTTPRVVTSVVEVNFVASPLPAEYSSVFPVGSPTASMILNNVWVGGGFYSAAGQAVELRGVELHGNVFAHEPITLHSCSAAWERDEMAVPFQMYSFGAISNKATCLDPSGAVAHASYNVGNHNATFPEVTVPVWRTRAWYIANANWTFNGDREFCSDAAGNVRHAAFGSCTATSPRVNNPDASPFEFGMILAKGNVRVHGTFKGKVTFVAAGPNNDSMSNGSSTLYIGNQSNSDGMNGTDDLRSKYTKAGVTGDAMPWSSNPEPGNCQNGLDPDPGGSDSIGLAAGQVRVDQNDRPCFVRAVIWAKDQVNFDLRCFGGCPDTFVLHTSFLETTNQLLIESTNRKSYFYYDSDMMASLPPGDHQAGVGTGTVTVVKKSLSEVFLK